MHLPLQGAGPPDDGCAGGGAVSGICNMDEETTRQIQVPLDLIGVFLRLRRVCFGRRIHYVSMAMLKALSPAAAFSVLRFWRSRGRFSAGSNIFSAACSGEVKWPSMATAICYFGLGQSIWGNPNSLGAGDEHRLVSQCLFWD